MSSNPFDLNYITPLNESPTDKNENENSTIASDFLSMETNRSNCSNSSRGKIDLTIVDVEMMINDSHERSIPRFPRIQMCNNNSFLMLQSPKIPIPDLTATMNLEIHHETHYQNKIIGESEIREDTSGSGIYLPISQALITAT